MVTVHRENFAYFATKDSLFGPFAHQKLGFWCKAEQHPHVQPHESPCILMGSPTTGSVNIVIY